MQNRTKWLLLITAACALFMLYEIRQEITTPLLKSLPKDSSSLLPHRDSSITQLIHKSKVKRKRYGPASDESPLRDPHLVSLHGNQVEFRVVDGMAIAYGDQILGRLDHQDTNLKKGLYDVPKTQIWERAEIPFFISPELPKPERVENAIEYLRQNTRLQFVPYEKQYDAIIFEPGTEHCYSYLGKVGGLQPIKLSAECDPQAILHEMMHVLGFIHEQSRPDRDQFVTILWENVQPDFMHQFNYVPESLFEYEKDSPFDYHSVMLYEPNAFARQPELTTLQSKKIDRIDPVTHGLSVGDLARIANLYRF